MKKFFNTINKFMTEISEDNINAHAAASAFYMFIHGTFTGNAV